MYLPIRIPSILLALSLTTVALGCAGASEDDEALEGSEHAIMESDYASLVGAPPKVTRSTAPTDEASATVHLVGHIPSTSVDKLAGKLVDFDRWKEIKKGEAFSATAKSSDSGPGDKRTTEGKVTTTEGSFELPLRATVTGAETKTVLIENPSSVRYLLKEVIKPGRFSITVKLVPYEGGVVVDATAKVKLQVLESKAEKVTKTVEPLFDWLK